MVKRFSPAVDTWGRVCLWERDQGMYVLASDYDALAAELAATQLDPRPAPNDGVVAGNEQDLAGQHQRVSTEGEG